MHQHKHRAAFSYSIWHFPHYTSLKPLYPSCTRWPLSAQLRARSFSVPPTAHNLTIFRSFTSTKPKHSCTMQNWHNFANLFSAQLPVPNQKTSFGFAFNLGFNINQIKLFYISFLLTYLANDGVASLTRKLRKISFFKHFYQLSKNNLPT